MAFSLPSLDEINDLTTCPVCMHSYDATSHKPKFLQCSHTACIACLTQIFRNNELICPICRRPSEVPNVGVRGIPNNNYALILVEHLARKIPLESSASVALNVASDPSLNQLEETTEWCFTCGKPATSICSLSSRHAKDFLSRDSLKKAQMLQSLTDQTKENWASAARDRWKYQSQLQLVQSSLKNLQFRLETEIEDNDRQLAELVSLIDVTDSDSDVNLANLEFKIVEYAELLTQARKRVSLAKPLTSLTTSTAAGSNTSYGPISTFISYLEKKQPKTEPERPIAVANSVQRPKPNSLFTRKVRMVINGNGTQFGMVEMNLLPNLPIIASSSPRMRSCSILSSNAKTFVACGSFEDPGKALPIVQTPEIRNTGDIGLYEMHLTASGISWSLLFLTGPFKQGHVRKVKCIGQVISGLDVLCKLCCLPKHEKGIPLNISFSNI